MKHYNEKNGNFDAFLPKRTAARKYANEVNSVLNIYISTCTIYTAIAAENNNSLANIISPNVLCCLAVSEFVLSGQRCNRSCKQQAKMQQHTVALQPHSSQHYYTNKILCETHNNAL